MNDLEWAEELVGARRIVIHGPTETVGRVKALKVDGALTAIEFEEGHTFVANEDAFIPLSDREAECFMNVLRVFGEMTKEVARLVAEQGLTRAAGLLLISQAMRNATRVVDQARKAEAPRG